MTRYTVWPKNGRRSGHENCPENLSQCSERLRANSAPYHRDGQEVVKPSLVPVQPLIGHVATVVIAQPARKHQDAARYTGEVAQKDDIKVERCKRLERKLQPISAPRLAFIILVFVYELLLSYSDEVLCVLAVDRRCLLCSFFFSASRYLCASN